MSDQASKTDDSPKEPRAGTPAAASERRSDPNAADDFARQVKAAGAGRGRAPVHLWNPPFCGDLDIKITRDGRWWYLGTPIGRDALVQLFASVLRRDEDQKFYLVTPVEKVGITVEDAPFVGVDVAVEGAGRAQALTFETNLGDRATAGPQNPLRVEIDADTDEPTPYVLVRGRLEARIDRKTFYRLVDVGVVAPVENPFGWPRSFGVWSAGSFFPLADADLLEAALGEALPVSD